MVSRVNVTPHQLVKCLDDILGDGSLSHDVSLLHLVAMHSIEGLDKVDLSQMLRWCNELGVYILV